MSDLNGAIVPANEENGKQPLMDLINEMQDAVTEMKQAFVVALEQLKKTSEDDASLRRTVENNKADAQEQAAQVLRLVLSFKSEFAWVRSALEAAQEQSASLARAIQRMEGDRDALLDELVSCGAISQHARDRLHSSSGNIHYHCDVRPENSSSSGAPSSSDSGVAHLLERAHAAFSIAPHPPPLYPNNENNSRQKMNGAASTSVLEGHSWPTQAKGTAEDGNLNQVSRTMVRDYVAGLVSGKGVGGGLNGEEAGRRWGEEAEEEEMIRRREEFAMEVACASSPDSDSSLSRAITKSLGLSTSLGRQCGLELDQTNGTSSVPVEHQSSSSTHPIANKSRESSLKAMHTPSDSDTESSRLLTAKPKYSVGDRTDGSSGLRIGLNEKNKMDVISTSRKSTDEKNSKTSEEGDFEKRRQALILELIDTEHCYCATLRTLRRAFAEPLSMQNILSPKDVDTLFPREVETLHQQHTSLLTMLEELVNEGPGPEQRSLGDILRHFIEPEGLDAVHLYTSYVDNFPDALQTFHKLCRCSPEFTNFLKDCLKSPDCGGLDFGGFLLTPVQRLPRLVLVLRRLLAVIPQHHPDWEPISFTITRLATFLSRLNDSMEHSFQLVAAQLAPSETEEDFGHSGNFDDVCDESTANDDCLETLNDLTSEGETGTEANSSISVQAAPLASVETEICDTGVRRRVGQKVVSSEWEKSRTFSAISGGAEVSSYSGTSSPIGTSAHANPQSDRVSEETRPTQKQYHREETPTKKVGCQCIRRCREVRGVKKYSKLCSTKNREGKSNVGTMHDGAPVRLTSEWGMVGNEQGDGDQTRKRPSRGVERSTHVYTTSSPSCCIHECSGCTLMERRRGSSVPRRGGCSSDVRRRTHSTGRSSRERDTSSDDDEDDSTGPKSCFHTSSQECKSHEVTTSPSKAKVKRRWFKTSKSMHDFQNEVSEVLRGEEGKEMGGNRRRQSSVDRDGKLSVARSVDNLSVNSSLSSRDGMSGEGMKKVGAAGASGSLTRQVVYTAKMLRCSSLEVSTMGKVNEGSRAVDKGLPGDAKEDGECGKRGKNKKLSLRASIKNMLSFKRREENQPTTITGPKCACQLSLPKNADMRHEDF